MRSGAAIVVAFALASGGAHACRALEFAELESMRADQVLKLRCQYRADMFQWLSLASESMKGSLRAGQADMARSNRCAEELDRLDRILARKQNISGDDKAVAMKINEMCPAPPK